MSLRRMRLLPKYCKAGVRTPPPLAKPTKTKNQIRLADFTKHVCSGCGNRLLVRKKKKHKKKQTVCPICRTKIVLSKRKRKNRKQKPPARRPAGDQALAKVSTPPTISVKSSPRKSEPKRKPDASKTPDPVVSVPHEAAKTKAQKKPRDVKRVPAWAPGCDTCD